MASADVPKGGTTQVRVTLAGQLAIAHGGATATEADLGVGQAQLVFAMLVRERGHPLPRHELAEVLWPGDLPAAWASALRTLVSRVRSFIAQVGIAPEALTSVGGSYQLRIDDVVVDVEEGERLAMRAAQALAEGRAADAVADARAALADLSHPLLAALDSPWLDAWRDVLRDAVVRAGEVAAAAMLATGDAPAAVDIANQTITRAPYRESAYRLLIRGHDAAGNRAEALRSYERCRQMLAEELGVSPAPETEALYVALLGTEPLPAAEPAPPVTATAAEDAAASGTVTFLLSEIDVSPSWWEHSPDAMSDALATHDALVRRAVEAHGGRIFRSTASGVAAVFGAAREGLVAAVDAQRAIAASDGQSPPDASAELGALGARMAIHTGEAEPRGEDFAGVALNRVERLCTLAHGGQILVSSSARLVVEGRLPTPIELRRAGDLQLLGSAASEPVYQLIHPDLTEDFSSVSFGHRQRDAVLAEDGPLLGRDDELTVVVSVMQRVRLVSITGPAGVGKTRLALAAANRVGMATPSRVWWVELGAVDASGLADAVANVVGGLGPGTNVIDALAARLSEEPAAVIFDNCERVSAKAGEVVRVLLNRCPDLRVLVTSRVPLGLAGEHIVTLRPLALPVEGAKLAAVADSPAVALFAHPPATPARGSSSPR